jgi:hypothetical protein
MNVGKSKKVKNNSANAMPIFHKDKLFISYSNLDFITVVNSYNKSDMKQKLILNEKNVLNPRTEYHDIFASDMPYSNLINYRDNIIENIDNEFISTPAAKEIASSNNSINTDAKKILIIRELRKKYIKASDEYFAECSIRVSAAQKKAQRAKLKDLSKKMYIFRSEYKKYEKCTLPEDFDINGESKGLWTPSGYYKNYKYTKHVKTEEKDMSDSDEDSDEDSVNRKLDEEINTLVKRKLVEEIKAEPNVEHKWDRNDPSDILNMQDYIAIQNLIMINGSLVPSTLQNNLNRFGYNPNIIQTDHSTGDISNQFTSHNNPASPHILHTRHVNSSSDLQKLSSIKDPMDKVFEAMKLLRWPDKDEHEAKSQYLNNIPNDVWVDIIPTMKKMSDELLGAIHEKMGDLNDMSDDNLNDFLFHIIAKVTNDSNMYLQVLVDPEFCTYLLDQYQPLYTMLKTKFRNLDW